MALGPSANGTGHHVDSVALAADFYSYGWELQWRAAASLAAMYRPDGGGSFELNSLSRRLQNDIGDDQSILGTDQADGDILGQRILVPDLQPVSPSQTVGEALAEAATTARTLETWVKLLDTGKGRGHVLFDGIGAARLALHDPAFGDALSLGGGGHIAAVGRCSFRNAAGPAPLRQWLHIVGVWDGDVASTTRVYVDGVLVSEGNCEGAFPDPDADTNTARRHTRPMVRLLWGSATTVWSRRMVRRGDGLQYLGPQEPIAATGGMLSTGCAPDVLSYSGTLHVLYAEHGDVTSPATGAVVDAEWARALSLQRYGLAPEVGNLVTPGSVSGLPEPAHITGVMKKREDTVVVATTGGVFTVSLSSSTVQQAYENGRLVSGLALDPVQDIVYVGMPTRF